MKSSLIQLALALGGLVAFHYGHRVEGFIMVTVALVVMAVKGDRK